MCLRQLCEEKEDDVQLFDELQNHLNIISEQKHS